MMNSDYNLLLQDPRWKAKSLEIRERDNYTCQKCNATNCILHVHHKYYHVGKLPWEYKNKCFITLCEACHKKIHSTRDILSFYSPAPGNKPKNKRKKQSTKKTRTKIKYTVSTDYLKRQSELKKQFFKSDIKPIAARKKMNEYKTWGNIK